MTDLDKEKIKKYVDEKESSDTIRFNAYHQLELRFEWSLKEKPDLTIDEFLKHAKSGKPDLWFKSNKRPKR